jgi:cytochrome bd-type quinol oxidase subunit 2
MAMKALRRVALMLRGLALFSLRVFAGFALRVGVEVAFRRASSRENKSFINSISAR